MVTKAIALKAINVFFGLVLTTFGFINIFYGNDPYFGLFIFSPSFFFYFPIIDFLREKLKAKTLKWAKIILAFFFIWTSLGVGDLEGKVRLMMESFPMPNITGV